MAIPDVAQQLKERVKASPFTMRDVCARAGVAASTPSRWSISKPNTATIEKLDRALDSLLRGQRRKKVA